MVGIAVAVNTPPVCLTAVSETFMLTDTERGILLGTLFWGFVAAIICAGPLGDRFGYKPLLVAASVLQTTGLLLSSLAPSYGVLLAGAVTLGVGSGVLEVLVSPLVCALRPHERTRAMNVCHGFYSVGAVGTLCLGMHFLKLGIPWRYLYAVLAIPVVVYGLGYSLCRLPTTKPEQQPGEATRLFWREPVLWWMLVVMLFIAGTEIGPAQWTPAYLEEVFGFERDIAGGGLLLFSSGMAIGRFAMGHFGTKFVPLHLLVLNCVCCAACLLAASLTHGRVIAVTALGALGLFVAAFWPTVIAYCADRIPHGGVTMFGALSAVGNSGAAVFPTMVGWIADRSSLRVGIGVLAVLPVVAATLFVRELLRGDSGR